MSDLKERILRLLDNGPEELHSPVGIHIVSMLGEALGTIQGLEDALAHNEITKLRKEVEQWRSMGRKFLHKVDIGLAQSTETYNEIKALIK